MIIAQFVMGRVKTVLDTLTMEEYNDQLAQLRQEIAEELETIRCLKAYRLILTEELNRLIDDLRCLQIRDLIRRIP